MRSNILCLLLVLFLTTTASALQVSYTLNVGDSYVIESEQTQVVAQFVMGQSMDINTSSVTSEQIDILSFENDVYTIKLTTLSMKADVSSPMMATTLDSEDPSSGIYHALKNTSYSFTMNSFGEVIDVLETKAVIAEVEGKLAGSPEASQVAAIFDKETLKTSLGTRFAIFSSDQTTTWETTQELSVNNMPVLFESTFENSLDGNVIISSNLTIDTSTNQMGMQMDLDLKGTQNGSYTLNKFSGMPETSFTKSVIEGTANTQGMSIPMTITTENAITIIKK